MSGLISNGTYVLGDPNTRDLYVQSPLTTGMSGTSAYIGVTTSALPGNETVLFSGDVTFSSNIALTETYKNFEFLKITNGHGQTFNISTDFLEASSTDAIGFYSYFPVSSGNNTEFYQLMYRPVDDTTLMAVSARDTVITTAGAVKTIFNSNNYSTRTCKVVGINRKA